MNDKTEIRLFQLAAIFLSLQALILTFSPAVRARSWDVDYLWTHWSAIILWAAILWLAHRTANLYIPNRDPYLLPIAALLSGWGLLSIWRLTPTFGLRQTIWLGISLGVMIIGLRLPSLLPTLRRYKYIWLFGGLILTALTLIFGSNPTGFGPRLWLGFGTIYLQPSEPLKLLLVVYLAAYLADRTHKRGQLLPFLFPILLLTGLALLLLLVQRDLGTASIFIVIFAFILYLATHRKRILFGSAAMLILTTFIGYFLSDIIRIRLDIWLSPWYDPSDKGYQIIQSLMAIANGGLFGRGLGLDSAIFVPVAHSDFIFTAIAEQTGLIGTLGLLTLIGIFLARGLYTALRASSRFHRLLAAGLVGYIGAQSLLIISGNLRLLPLTGVTLPFISYGGSSLLTSYVALLILLLISDQDEEPAPLPSSQPYLVIGGLLGLGLVAAALINGWWAIVRAPDLLTRSDNPRRAQSDLYVPRGALLDRNNTPINLTSGESGALLREYLYPDLASVAGYTHPVYGQAALEFQLDDYLRGLAGNPTTSIWWNHLLYGQPPSGLDLRLSIDLDLQTRADETLGNHIGAIVLLNAESGEILAMASHPTFDANLLDEIGESLSTDETSPLLNRATLGQYPLSAEMEALFNTSITPTLRLPTTESAKGYANPLQMALIAASLSNDGTAPAPRITLAVNTSQSGWVILPALGQPSEIFTPAETEQLLATFATEGQPLWQFISTNKDEAAVTWLLAGTTSDWGGTPLAMAVLLEEENTILASTLAENLLTNPQ